MFDAPVNYNLCPRCKDNGIKSRLSCDGNCKKCGHKNGSIEASELVLGHPVNEMGGY